MPIRPSGPSPSIGAPVEQLINPCMSVLAPARSASAMWTRASPIHGLDGYVRGACRSVQAASTEGPPSFVAAAAHTTTRAEKPSPDVALIVGVMPTSALRRSCRPRGYADGGIGSRARCGLPCESGRHNPDVITVLASGHSRDRAAWRGPHQQSARRRSRAETACRRGHRCRQGLDRSSHPCRRSRRRPRAPRPPGSRVRSRIMPTYSRGSPYPGGDSTPGRHNHEVGIVGVMRHNWTPHATAAAKAAKRSPDNGVSSFQVTAIGCSPSCRTYVAGPRNQKARSSWRVRAKSKIDRPMAPWLW
jgi:hypothetical protein